MDVVKVWENIKTKCQDLVCLGETIVSHLDPTFDIDNFRKYDTTVSVVNDDTLDVALEHPNSLLLNMANPQTPGGYLQTIGAQEEDLFRRTDLHKYLDKSFYPLSNKALLSTKVRVFSFGLRQRYKLLSQENHVDIITCAAVKNKILGNTMNPKDISIMKIKIELLYQTAILHNYSTLILSAFGCGGFGCPPEHVSQLFKYVNNKYQGCIKNVIFAIFDDNHPHSNYDVFQKCFS
uniref:Microbial-type PARG catalytic domain-containing protein n=1 Tax=Marseillevirus LCMAC102 TaxID=2506603 RepID=A0A481YU87_9VIRU|nr:MAG: protein of unknown function DUF2263 [Marseillevirus LCMAC102]